MNATHLHLLINHLPVFGSAIAIVLLGWALMVRSRELTCAGLILTLVAGGGAFIARQSGHEAEEQTEKLPWADRGIVHEHEEAADWAFILLSVAAVAGAVALVRMRGARPARVESTIVLVLLVLGFAAVARAALLGGRIRHEEVRPGFVFPAGSEDD
ncbi:MAG TPA: hypothetical protein VFI13_02245 [Gemmatimonadales bacterium]|nr:hypothetical protein [Gemmatimonadales bacterium]